MNDNEKYGYCRWYDKDLPDVTEWEQEKCWDECKRECLTCPELKGNEEYIND